MGLQRVRHDLVTEQQQEMGMSHLSGPGNCVTKKPSPESSQAQACPHTGSQCEVI